MNRVRKNLLALQIAFVLYLTGCVLWYFFWYKNGQFIHIVLISLVIGGIGVFISIYKARNVILKGARRYKTLLIILFIFFFVSVAGVVNHLAKKRVDRILSDGPTKHATATVINVDMRSTRSGKQAWSIINYNADGKTIEQSFADTSSDLRIGNKYLIEYSIQYPDMFRIIREMK